MTRPNRNGTCRRCDGKIRLYTTTVDGVDVHRWSHLERADWIDDPHDPEPTDASIDAAQIA